MLGLSRRTLPLLLSILTFAPAVPVVAAEDTCSLGEVDRVVAVGDVHGDYENFVRVLQMAGVVDERTRWSAGKTVLVQLGDVPDRGADTRRALDLLMRLEKEAKKAGGRVVPLLGNHEVMNMLGDLRYVNPEEYESFRTPRSEQLRERFWESILSRRRAAARAAGTKVDEAALRRQFEKEAPLGFVERTQAFSAKGEYGRWLRQHSVIARVNDVVFLHGGLTPEVAALGCRTINERVHHEITDGFDATRKDPLSTLAAGENGPLWFRGLAQEDEATYEPAVEQVLRSMDARAIVVGHTVTKTGRIQTRFGGRVVMIDAGMSGVYGEHEAALEVDPGPRLVALYPGEREVLGEPGPVPAAPPVPALPPEPAAAVQP
jgi:hypothetical protein